MTSRPWFDTRARSKASAVREIFCSSALPSAPEPLRSTSSPVERRGDLDVERFAETPEVGGERARRGERAGHAGAEQRTSLDLDDFVAAKAHEADFVFRMRQKAGVKNGAAAALAVGVDELANLRFDPGALQRGDDEAALPLR